MENRHTKRLLKKLLARVYFDYESYRDTLTMDVNKHGLLLKLCDPKLIYTKIVKVVLHDSETDFPWYTRAMVVHTSNHGVGVLLERDLPEAFYQVSNNKYWEYRDYRQPALMYSK